MSKRILIIEDESDIAHGIKDQLDLHGGFEVDVALGGKQGLEKMAVNQYDLVFLDLIMPEIDGKTVLKTLKDNPEKYIKSPIIALTNVSNEDTKKEVENLGVTKFVIKLLTDIDTVVDEFFLGK